MFILPSKCWCTFRVESAESQCACDSFIYVCEITSFAQKHTVVLEIQPFVMSQTTLSQWVCPNPLAECGCEEVGRHSGRDGSIHFYSRVQTEG